jgi:hypothetical protein
MVKLTAVQKDSAKKQLNMQKSNVKYDTKDYPVEVIVEKFAKNDFFVPDYQRQFIWRPADKSYFIESVLLGLPIPFMFWGECEDYRFEIIDGVQRINTLVEFIGNKLKLTSLKKLTELNGFTFCDLDESQQRLLKNKTLRIIVLDSSTTDELRRDIFSRVNRSGIRATDAEFRRGTYPGKLTNFIDSCRQDNAFQSICPLSKKKEDRYEGFELILRFFAFVNDYRNCKHRVEGFLTDFLSKNQDTFDEKQYYKEFVSMCDFVAKYIPNGFASEHGTKKVPRVRFEAISVGVALALRQNPDLVPYSISWLESEDFKEKTTSDSSNNPGRLIDRVEYVRDSLLGEKK